MDTREEPGSPEGRAPAGRVEEEAGAIREYDIVYDMIENTERMVGADDFYGRPAPDGRVSPHDLAAAVHPQDVDAFVDVMTRMAVMRPHETIDFQMRMLHADGRYVRSSYVIRAASYGPNGKPSRVIIHVRWLRFE